MSYSNGFQTTHTFAAAAIAGGGELGRIAPPAPGLTGRLVAVTNVVTTGVTVAADTISVGNAGDGDAYGTLAVPVSSAGAFQNALTRGVDSRVNADEVVIVSSAGTATAGAGDITVHIEWS